MIKECARRHTLHLELVSPSPGSDPRILCQSIVARGTIDQGFRCRPTGNWLGHGHAPHILDALQQSRPDIWMARSGVCDHRGGRPWLLAAGSHVFRGDSNHV